MARKVMVVDDDPAMVGFLSAILRSNGYVVRAAYSGREAIATLKTEVPDLVSLDISMQGQSGVTTYRAMKADERLAQVPVLMVTAISKGLEEFLCARAQIPKPEGFLEKPVEVEAYLAEVRRLAGDP